MNYYINKLNEFERLLNDWSVNDYTRVYSTCCLLIQILVMDYIVIYCIIYYYNSIMLVNYSLC